jgi:hypothetical protein
MAKAKGSPKTGGRQKGVPNKLTMDVRKAIIEAFEKAGGVDYLHQLATTDPKTFCTLLGKAVPTMVAGDAENPIQLKTKVEFVVLDPAR